MLGCSTPHVASSPSVSSMHPSLAPQTKSRKICIAYGADGSGPNSSRAEAEVEPSNARATFPAAMCVNMEDDYRYEENGPRVYHMTQEIAEGKWGPWSGSNMSDFSCSSNTIPSNSWDSEGRHLRKKFYRDRDDISAISGSGSVTSSSLKIESDIETLHGSQDEDVPEAPPHFIQQELESIQETVPRDEDGNLTSKGSLLHDRGTCTPCLFVHRNVGCHNGILCTFCHFPHKRRGKARLCKDKRDRFQRRVEQMEKKMDAEPHRIVEDPTWLEKLAQELPPAIEGNQFLRSKVMAKLYRHAEQLLADQNMLRGAEAASILDAAIFAKSSATIRMDMAQPLSGSSAGISTKTSL